MSTILILEDDIINEYEVNYDQEYMNYCLEDYREKHAYLTTCSSKKGGSGSVPIKANIVCDGMQIKSCIISAVNPAVYNILYDSKNDVFQLDNCRMFSLMSWYNALKNCSADIRREELPPIDNYQNIDERINAKENITELLSDVSIAYLGPSESDNKTIAKNNSDFISEFNITKNKAKIKSLV